MSCNAPPRGRLRRDLRFICILGILSGYAAARAEDTRRLGILSGGGVRELNVWLADTPEEWRTGLRGHDRLRDGEGLLLLFPRQDIYTVTTHGIDYPLDILLINEKNRIVHIYENAPLDRYMARAIPITAILELPGGYCGNNGISMGDNVRCERVRFKPKIKSIVGEEAYLRAEALLLKNLEASEGDAFAHGELADFYLRWGRIEKAEKFYKRIIDMKKTPERLNGFALLLLGQARLDEAAVVLRESLGLDSQCYETYQRLSMLYRLRDDPMGLQEMYETALRDHPRLLALRMDLFRFFLHTGDLTAARKVLDGVDEREWHHPEVIRANGDLCLRRGEAGDAAGFYERYLMACPNDPHTADIHAFITMHKRMMEQADEK
ncbi:DUF192 domain-containing protein [bacterium]|nr:DUF192 domain-containing protein [candidate division CSSED10-310 bacterium]